MNLNLETVREPLEVILRHAERLHNHARDLRAIYRQAGDRPLHRIWETWSNQIDHHLLSIVQNAYARLEATCSTGSEPDGHLPDGQQDALYRARAVFEEIYETDLALAALCSDNPVDSIRDHIRNKTANLPAAFFDSVVVGRRFLFVGSGAFPTTALALTTKLDCRITCLDRNLAANEIARSFVAKNGSADRVHIIDGDVLSFPDIAAFDTVIFAFLVGVETRPDVPQKKSDLVSKVLEQMAPKARLIARSPLAEASRIYPYVDLDPAIARSIRHVPANGPIRYDFPFLIIEKDELR
ncbi:MAG: nicotianamine synthase family protein [Pseudomonadota bacterium]